MGCDAPDHRYTSQANLTVVSHCRLKGLILQSLDPTARQ